MFACLDLQAMQEIEAFHAAVSGSHSVQGSGSSQSQLR